MLGDGKWNSGDQGSFFKYQYGVLKLLETINSSIAALPGVDYETRTTTYQATAAGPGYVIGNIIVRYDIIDVATSTLSATIWFNQSTQLAIAAPAPANIIPIAAPSSVTVINGVLGAAVNIQDGGNSITVDALTLPLPTGAATAALQTQPGVDIGDVTVNNAAGASAVNIQDGGNSITVDGTITANAGTNLNTSLLALDSTLTNKTQFAKITDGTNDATVKAASTAAVATDKALVVAISPNNAITTTAPTSATSTNTTVARNAASVTILAANASRKGATIYNDSVANLFIKFAAAATTASFTTRLTSDTYYEIPFGYTGIVSGIWASAGAGNALMSELT